MKNKVYSLIKLILMLIVSTFLYLFIIGYFIYLEMYNFGAYLIVTIGYLIVSSVFISDEIKKD